MRMAIYAFMYCLPSLAGWLVSNFTGAHLPLRRLFLLNLLIAWTGLGWEWLFAQADGAGTWSGGGEQRHPNDGLRATRGDRELQRRHLVRAADADVPARRRTSRRRQPLGFVWRKRKDELLHEQWGVTCTSCSGSGYGW